MCNAVQNKRRDYQLTYRIMGKCICSGCGNEHDDNEPVEE
jgi:hypothetical protein